MPKSSNFWRSASLTQQILLAFLLVVTPLGVLLYQAGNALVKQSQQGRTIAQHTLEMSQRGQQLLRLAENVNRAARQYQILRRDDILERLKQQVSEYHKLLAVQSFILEKSSASEPLQSTLMELEKLQAVEENARALLSRTAALNEQLESELNQRLKALNQKAQDTQQKLIMLSALLISLSAVLILFFTARLTRPVRLLAGRIKALGGGERSQGRRIGGPKELEALNQQLDWLSEQLQAAETEKQRFLRHMSHELKTPLTTLREGSDLLAEGVAGELSPEQQEIVNLLQQGARQLQSLIEQLLDYNRMQQYEPVDMQPQAIRTLMREALDPNRLLLNQKEIQVSLPPDEVYWPTDRAMLLRVISNLISNAAQYGTDRGKLNIALNKAEDQLMIDVENSGPTIPDEDLPRLFDPFYQGKNKRSGPVKGSGIGLSIARDAAEALGAELSLKYNADNRVCFRLTLNDAN
ncbi:sensor histidine kinase [Marinobacterium jannaschii]|uniref:sensor histidine kinase n=1 Tax=Marinobacterium jannaschii TaxID=64970 RepID=UPI00055EE7D3|nr:HAMP domain-containing sensor histidine kinase [Marinobacterium jannaschii]